MPSRKKTHLTTAKRVLRYLKSTAGAKLVFPSSKASDSLIGYTDSDFANDKADRKSQGGYVFHLHGGPISWQSRKQRLVALSTTEAEYVACSEALEKLDGSDGFMSKSPAKMPLRYQSIPTRKEH